jgi:Leucine-rich repeat (LRR) protein
MTMARALLLIGAAAFAAHLLALPHRAGWSESVASAQSPPTDEAGIAAVIARLGDNNFGVRESATFDLLDAGPQAIPAIARAACSEDAEVRMRAMNVLLAFAQGNSDHHIVPAHRAMHSLATSSDALVARRAELLVTRLESQIVAQLQRTGANVQMAGSRVELVNLDDRTGADKTLAKVALLPGLKTLALNRAVLSDAGLVHLRGHPELVNLELRGTGITDAGLAHLTTLPQLRRLNLQATAIDDRSAATLAQLKSLTLLSVERTRLTSGGLAELRSLANLETLYLGESSITGDGLEIIPELPRLKYLSLRGLKVGDEQLAPLAVCTQLEAIGLDETPVSENGLKYLAAMKLKVLWLTNTQVGDGGFELLANMKSLERLYIKGTKITGPRAEDLRRALSAAQIEY